MDDTDLVERAAGGDREAFAAIYRRYHAVVYRFARLMSGSAAMAEDLTQETFVVLMSDLRRYTPARGALPTYLYGVARNLTRSRLRREARFVTLERAATRLAPGDPLETIGVCEERDSLRCAIRSLPSRYREVVILCALHGLSYAAAASALDMPIGTVRSRLNRGKQALAERLLAERQGKLLTRVARCVV